MVGEEFLDRLDFYKSSWLPAREVVEEAVKKRHQVRSCPFCLILHFLYLFAPAAVGLLLLSWFSGSRRE